MTLHEFKTLTLDDGKTRAAQVRPWSMLGRLMVETDVICVGELNADQIEHVYLSTAPDFPSEWPVRATSPGSLRSGSPPTRLSSSEVNG
jgi:hypothetical protein